MAELAMEKTQPYPVYQPTGVEWMPEIPVGWRVKKLKTFIADLESGVSVNSFDEPATDEEIGILKTSCVYSYAFDQSENKKVLAEELDRVRVPVKGNTLIISRMNTPDLVGASGYVESDVPNLFLPDRLWQTVFSEHPQVACLPKWLSYVFVSAPFRMLITSLATGTSPSMKNISKEEVLNIQVALPPLPEQRAIARFLDDKTAQLDRLITQKRQMLELLREERAALLNHAVTKGLDAAAPRRESGVAWLGEVPAHWEVKRLKHVVKSLNYKRVPLSAEERGKMIMRKYDYYGASGVIDQVEDYLFDGTLILIGEDGANLLSRNTRLAFTASGKFWVNNHAHILDPVDNNTLYLSEMLENIDYSIYVTGSAQPKLTQEALLEIIVPLPPVKEQNIIADYLKKENGRVDEIAFTINQEIALLQEYRAALIAEAVTGQIDVRDYEPAAAGVLM